MAGAHREDGPRESSSDTGPPPDPNQRDDVRGWAHLTIAEQVCGAIGFLATFALLEATNQGWPPWVVGPVLAGCYTLAASFYATRTRPWRGPRVLRRTSGGVAVASRASRIRAWWRAPGRRGLVVAAVGLFLVFGGFGGAADDSTLLRDLRLHGVHGEATVRDVNASHVRYGRTLDSVSVEFQNRGGVVVEDLQIIDTVPDSIATGDQVAIVFDPDSPANVLLASAMGTDHVTQDYVVGGVGIVAMVAGSGWWWLRRAKRRARR